MMIKQALFLLGTLSLCASVHAAGNAAEGQKKSTACAACHGPDGNTPVIPDAPKLAGQHKDYLYKVLADYRSYVKAHEQVDIAYRDTARWAKMAILNTARRGKFSSDRTIKEYADDIWSLSPVRVP